MKNTSKKDLRGIAYYLTNRKQNFKATNSNLPERLRSRRDRCRPRPGRRRWTSTGASRAAHHGPAAEMWDQPSFGISLRGQKGKIPFFQIHRFYLPKINFKIMRRKKIRRSLSVRNFKTWWNKTIVIINNI